MPIALSVHKSTVLIPHLSASSRLTPISHFSIVSHSINKLFHPCFIFSDHASLSRPHKTPREGFFDHWVSEAQSWVQSLDLTDFCHSHCHHDNARCHHLLPCTSKGRSAHLALRSRADGCVDSTYATCLQRPIAASTSLICIYSIPLTPDSIHLCFEHHRLTLISIAFI